MAPKTEPQAREGMARKGGFRSSDPRVSLSGKPAGSKAQLINVSDEVKKKQSRLERNHLFSVRVSASCYRISGIVTHG